MGLLLCASHGAFHNSTKDWLLLGDWFLHSGLYSGDFHNLRCASLANPLALPIKICGQARIFAFAQVLKHDIMVAMVRSIECKELTSTLHDMGQEFSSDERMMQRLDAMRCGPMLLTSVITIPSETHFQEFWFNLKVLLCGICSCGPTGFVQDSSISRTFCINTENCSLVELNLF